MIQALILTAGVGQRLDPLTRLVAKPAVPLGGRTLIEHVLTWVHRQGVTDVVMNLHHRPATLTTIVGDGAHLGLSVRYSWEQPLLGSAGGPRHALGLLDSDPFVVINGDTLCSFDLAPMIKTHLERRDDVTMAVVPNPAPAHYNGIAADPDGRITGFRPRGQAEGTWHFVGVQVARAAVFADLPDGKPAETVSGIYRDRVARRAGRLGIWHAPTTFLDVGTPRDYLAAAIASPPAVPGGAGRLVRTVVWPDAVVSPTASLTDCIVAGPVQVPDGFQAHGAVIVPRAVLRSDEQDRARDGVAVFPM